MNAPQAPESLGFFLWREFFPNLFCVSGRTSQTRFPDFRTVAASVTVLRPEFADRLKRPP